MRNMRVHFQGQSATIEEKEGWHVVHYAFPTSLKAETHDATNRCDRLLQQIASCDM